MCYAIKLRTSFGAYYVLTLANKFKLFIIFNFYQVFDEKNIHEVEKLTIERCFIEIFFSNLQV